jgi:hypothetical protein
MNKFLWAFVLVFIGALFFLIYTNRAHQNIQQIVIALIGLIATVLGVFLFGDKIQAIKKTISVVSFVSIEQKKPVFPIAPVLNEYFMHQGTIWSDFERDHPDLASEAMKKLPQSTDDLNILTEIHAIAIMQYLGRSYHSDWDILEIAHVLPGFASYRGQGLNTNPKDKTTYDSAELVEIFKSNIFNESLKNISQLTLPKGTHIKYIQPSGELKQHQIIISKKYSFVITIQLYFSTYSAGLGKVANYVGVTKPTNVWNVNWEERDKYGTAVVTIKCTAKFPFYKSGNPEVQRYQKWIQNLFENMYEEFDWSICNNKMKEYNEELAHQVIINDLGKGFEQNKR